MGYITSIGICLWTVLLIVSVPEVTPAAHRGSWSSCQGAICSEVQRQAQGLTRLKLLRHYIVQTMQLMDSMVTSLDEELIKTGEGLSVFIGPHCEAAHSLLKHVTTSNISADRFNSATAREDLEGSESSLTQTISTEGDLSQHRESGRPIVMEETSAGGGGGSEVAGTDGSQYVAPTYPGGRGKGTWGSGSSSSSGFVGSSHGSGGGFEYDHPGVAPPGGIGGGHYGTGSSGSSFAGGHSGLGTPGSSSGPTGSDGRFEGGYSGSKGSGSSGSVGHGSGGSGSGSGSVGHGYGGSDSSSGSVGHGYGGSGSSSGSVGHGSGGSGSSSGSVGHGSGGSYSSSGSVGHGSGYGGSASSSGSWSTGKGSSDDGDKGQWTTGTSDGSGKSIDGTGCRGIEKGSPHWVPGLDPWCKQNCAANYCPETLCVC